MSARTAMRSRRCRSAAAMPAWSTSSIALSGLTALACEVLWTRLDVAALRGDDVHVLADPRRVPRRSRSRQQRRRDAGPRTGPPPRRARLVPARALRGDGVDGVDPHRFAAVLADQPVALRPTPGSSSSWISCAALFAVLPGIDPVGHELSARARLGRHERRGSGAGWSAASMPRTRSAPSSARSTASLVLVVWLGTQHAQQVLIVARRAVGAHAACREPRVGSRPCGGRRTSAGAAGAERAPRARRVHRVRALHRDAAWPVRRSSTAAKDGTHRSRCRSGPTASATITTPGRCRRRASRRTCACSACSDI